MKKTTLALLTLLMANASTPAFSKTSYTLEESLNNAFTYNPQIADVKEAENAAKHKIRAAQAGYFPSIGIWAGTGFEQETSKYARDTNAFDDTTYTTEMGVNLSQMLWDGMQTASNVAVSKALHDFSVYSVMDSATSIAFSTLSMHIDIVRRQQLIEKSNKNVKSLQRIVGLLQRRHKEGLTSRGELEQGILRYNNAKATNLSHINAYNEARTTYKRLTGKEAPENLESIKSPKHIYTSIEELQNVALDKNPTLNMAKAQHLAASEEKSLSKSAFSPRFTFDVGPSYKTNDTADNKDIFAWNAMINMQWEIYSGGENMSNYKAALAKERQYSHKQLDAKDSIFEQIKLTYDRTQTALSQYPFYDNAQKSGKIALANFYKQFEVGQKDLLNLLDMENEFFLSEVSAIIAQTDAIIGQYRMHALAGTLLEELNIDTAELKK